MTGPLREPPGASAPDGIEFTREGARQVLRSPEQVVLHLPVAGPASRMLAYAIDWLAILLLQLLIFTALGLAFASSTAFAEWVREPLRELVEDVDPADPGALLGSAFLLLAVAVFLAVQLVAEWGYFVASEMASGGRSLGKALVGLRVVQDGGLPLTLRASLARNVLRIVDVLPTSYLVGFVSIVVSPESKRLGDYAAGTLVVRLDRPPPAPPLAEDDPAAGGFRFERAELARLGRNERALLRQTLRRVEGLDAERAAVLLERACAALSGRLERPPVPPPERLGFLRALHAASRRR